MTFGAYFVFMMKMTQTKRTTLLLAFSALLFSGCSTIEGATNDVKNWGSFIDSKFGADKQEEQAQETAQSFQNQSVLASNCPVIEQEPALTILHEFENPLSPSADSKIAQVDIASINNKCAVQGEFVSVTMDIAFNSVLGPKARAKASDRPFFSFPYFIAVTDMNGEVLAKEVFAVSMSFGQGEEAVQTIETIQQNLPLEADGSLPNYKMQVGFELTDEQLNYNRGL